MHEANFFLQKTALPIRSMLSFAVLRMLACQYIKTPEEDKSWFVYWTGSQETLHDLESMPAEGFFLPLIPRSKKLFLMNNSGRCYLTFVTVNEVYKRLRTALWRELSWWRSHTGGRQQNPQHSHSYLLWQRRKRWNYFALRQGAGTSSLERSEYMDDNHLTLLLIKVHTLITRITHYISLK